MRLPFLLIASLSLKFSILFSQSANYNLVNGWYYIIQENKGIELQLDKTNSYYFIDSLPIVISKNIREISIQIDSQKNPYLKIQFDSTGTKAWELATRRSINRKLGFIFNSKLIQAPTVNSEIEFGIAAIWDYSKEELILIKSILENERDKSP